MNILTAPFVLLARHFAAQRRRDDESDVWPWPGADGNYRARYETMREDYRRRAKR